VKPLSQLAGFALALLLCGSAMAGPADDALVTEQPGRDGPSRVAEPAALSQLQLQLDGLGAAGADCTQQYTAHKAQAWINFAKYAHAEQLPHDVQSAAAASAGALVQALAQHHTVSHDTPELPHARHVRDDLWRGIAAAEADGRVCGAPQMTAYCEVELAWADYESGAGGWRHADPYVRIAEDYCHTAMAAAAPPVAVVPPAVTPPAAQAAAPSEPDLTVLFPHDRSGGRDIRAPGHAELAQLAQRWKGGHHGRVHVTGHADITGHAKYNLRLSARRAASVARELEQSGIPLADIDTAALGSTQNVVACSRPGEAAERRRYLACLEPNRRVVVHIDEP
jgi:outer membrane protein OmpA-like peptidoglycan-associated protein